MKSKVKKRLGYLLLLALPIFLAGCRVNTEPITANSTGLWDRYIIYNLSQLINWVAHLFGDNYGISIIIVTIIVRLVLIPLYHYQMKSSEVMQAIQPEMQVLREKYASKDIETQQKLQEELRALNKKHNYNPISSFLPLILQLPILMAFYEAIRRTEAISSAHFLWMQLGLRDPYFILPIIAAILTFYNTKLMTISSGTNNPSMNVMQWAMPIMILLMGASLPSALALYWVVGTAFSIGQLLLLNNPYKKRDQRLAKEKHERKLQRELNRARKNPRKYR